MLLEKKEELPEKAEKPDFPEFSECNPVDSEDSPVFISFENPNKGLVAWDESVGNFIWGLANVGLEAKNDEVPKLEFEVKSEFVKGFLDFKDSCVDGSNNDKGFTLSLACVVWFVDKNRLGSFNGFETSSEGFFTSVVGKLIGEEFENKEGLESEGIGVGRVNKAGLSGADGFRLAGFWTNVFGSDVLFCIEVDENNEPVGFDESFGCVKSIICFDESFVGFDESFIGFDESFIGFDKSITGFDTNNDSLVGFEVNSDCFDENKDSFVGIDENENSFVGFGVTGGSLTGFDKKEDSVGGFGVICDSVVGFEVNNEPLVGFDGICASFAGFGANKDSFDGFDPISNSFAGFDVNNDSFAGFDVNNDSFAGFDINNDSFAGFDANNDSFAGFDANKESLFCFELKGPAFICGLEFSAFPPFSVLCENNFDWLLENKDPEAALSWLVPNNDLFSIPLFVSEKSKIWLVLIILSFEKTEELGLSLEKSPFPWSEELNNASFGLFSETVLFFVAKVDEISNLWVFDKSPAIFSLTGRYPMSKIFFSSCFPGLFVFSATTTLFSPKKLFFSLFSVVSTGASVL